MVSSETHCRKKKLIWYILSIIATVTGLLLIFIDDIHRLMSPLIFDTEGHHRTVGIFGILAQMLDRCLTFFGKAWLFGFPLLLVGGVGVAHTQAVPLVISGYVERNRWGLSALVASLLANLFIIISSADFFFVPADMNIRPMMWAVAVLFMAASAVAICLPLVLVALSREFPSIPGMIGLVLMFVPYPLAMILLALASRICGFTIGD